MIALLADENIPPLYVESITRRVPNIDIVRVQAVGLRGASDPDLLEYSAQTGRVVITLDTATFADHAYDRLLSGRSFPGVLVIRGNSALRNVMDDLELILLAMTDADMFNTVRRIPL